MPQVRANAARANAASAQVRFVPQTDVSADKMLRSARMAAMTGHAAAIGSLGQWRLWAASNERSEVGAMVGVAVANGSK